MPFYTSSSLASKLEKLNPMVREKAREIATNLLTQQKFSEEEAMREAVKLAAAWALDQNG